MNDNGSNVILQLCYIYDTTEPFVTLVDLSTNYEVIVVYNRLLSSPIYFS